MNLMVLPSVNASLNVTTAVLLVLGWALINRKNTGAHKRVMLAACLSSTLFLAGYLTFHYYHGSTKFQGQGAIRPAYFTILITHTVLAAAIVPLVLKTLYHALRGQIYRHKRLARITLPLWLYVSVTGVVVYWMLYRVTY